MGEQACLDALVANTLTIFEDDGVTKVGANCLRNHTALTNVTLPQCKSVESYGLANCTALTTVDMLGGSTGTIAADTFNGDTALAHLILRSGSMTTLSNTSAFTSTPISSGNGAVYVPLDLLATYKAHNGWKNYVILPLSAYPATDFSTITESWAELDAMTQAQIEAKYAVGDTKLVDLGTEGKVYAQIAGFGLDDLASSDKAKVTFVAKGLLATNRRMNSGSTTAGGWAASVMRTYLSGTILPLMPSELQSAIKEVTKYSDGYENSAIVHDETTTDKLWIPSAREVYGGTSYEQTGPVYGDLFGGNSARVRYDQSGSASNWWLRSAYSAGGFRRISTSGSMSSYEASGYAGVAVGFCI